MSFYNLNVFRFDPSVDSQLRFDAHQLESKHTPTILEALRIIRRDTDPGLSFRESCGLGKCGSCAVRQNGKSVLACQTRLIEGDNRIEPLPGFPVIRDLVIDRSGVDKRLERFRAFFSRPDYLKEGDTPYQWSENYRKLTECIECLICDSSCPSLRKNDSRFQGPMSYGQMARALTHPLDKGKVEVSAWTDGIHNCAACMTCEQVCPKELDVFRNGIAVLRSRIVEDELDLPTTQQTLLDLFEKTGKSVPLSSKNLEHPAIDPSSRTAIFFGCMFGDRYPEQGRQALDLLDSVGEHVRIPEGLKCCGGPPLWIGQKKLADDARDVNLDILVSSGVERVITPCAGCGMTIKHDYREAFRRKNGIDLPFEVLDFMELFSRISASKIGNAEAVSGEPLRVAYHSPCHQGLCQGLFETTTSFIKSIPGITWVEHDAIENCCGGIIALSNRPLMQDMSSGIVKEVERAGAGVLLTSCIFCRDNIQQAARVRRSPVKVMHTMAFLMEQLQKKEMI